MVQEEWSISSLGGNGGWEDTSPPPAADLSSAWLSLSFFLANSAAPYSRFLCYSAREGGRRALGREEWQDRTTQVLLQVRSEGEKSLFAPGPKTALGVGSNTTAGTTRPAKYL